MEKYIIVVLYIPACPGGQTQHQEFCNKSFSKGKFTICVENFVKIVPKKKKKINTTNKNRIYTIYTLYTIYTNTLYLNKSINYIYL